MRRAVILSLAACLAAWPLAAEAANGQPGDGKTPMLFTADEVQYDEELGLVIAKGHVEISQKDQILLADTVTYNQRTDTVTASGHVSLLQPTGDIVFADFVELHDDLREGFIKDARLLLSDRSRMAGNTARRIAGNRTELRRVVYSPCELCRDDPTQPPLWQIKAEEVVHDRALQIVEYRDATMEIGGLPIFYTPYLSHPDPSVKRATGFLPPVIGSSSSLGFHTAIPYYWVLGPDKDATFRPLLTTIGGQVLGGQYRQRFGNGRIQTDGSIAFGSSPAISKSAAPLGDIRGHLFSTGEFDLNENWRTGFDVRRTSDQTYLQRYRFQFSNDFLTSRLYAEDFGQRSYGNVSAYSFQSLRPGVPDKIQPIAAPLANYNWTSLPDSLGGRWSVNGNALDLVRIQGTDMRRLSAGTEWRVPFNGAIGDRFTFTAGVRGDGYHSDNLLFSPTDNGTHSAAAGRVFPQIALNWRYPWVRNANGYTQIFEPLVALVAAPNGGNPAKIPNEDSQGFEFDDTSLFRRNRFPGYDRVDSGQRVDYGFHTGVYGDGGGNTQLLVGQSYRAQHNSAFQPGSGLETRRSDVVGRINVSPSSYLDLVYRFRLDKDDLALRRQEAGLSAGPANLRIGLNYISISSISGVTGLQATRQGNISVNAALTRYWSTSLTGTRDFTPDGGTLASGVALTYRDECLSFTTSVTQSGISNRDVRPGLSVLFTVVFRNLGEVGLTALSLSGT